MSRKKQGECKEQLAIHINDAFPSEPVYVFDDYIQQGLVPTGPQVKPPKLLPTSLMGQFDQDPPPAAAGQAGPSCLQPKPGAPPAAQDAGLPARGLLAGAKGGDKRKRDK